MSSFDNKQRYEFTQNIFHQNTKLSDALLRNADYDLFGYIKYLEKSIDNAKKDVISLRVETRGRRHYIRKVIAKNPENQLERFFTDMVSCVYTGNESFKKDEGVEITEKNSDEGWFTTALDINLHEVYIRPDTRQLSMQINAIRKLKEQPQPEHVPLLRLFGDAYEHHTATEKDFNNIKVSEWHVLTDSKIQGVDEQRDFVKKALNTPDFALLEGPPGSGKTTVIIELIIQLLKMGKRILLCSATHAAIDNVIERIYGRYREQCAPYVAVARTGREGVVKDSVKDHLFENVMQTSRLGIKNFLDESKKSAPREFLRIAMQDNAPAFDNLIIDSMNLVAGTMIGILSWKEIRESAGEPVFDYLIVDEASKVTFADFIVPAMHAKRWILVGDIKQLSPYVEDGDIAENLDALENESIKRVLAAQYDFKRALYNKDFRKIPVYEAVSDFNLEKKMLGTFADKVLSIESALLSDAEKSRIKDNIGKYRGIMHNGGAGFAYIKTLLGEDMAVINTDKDSREWKEKAADMMNRKYFFRDAGDELRKMTQAEAEMLIREEIKEDAAQIEKYSFPSVLEMLQKGLGPGKGQKTERLFSHGLHEKAKQHRFRSLTYQHRMHPSIASIASENFYSGQNLISSDAVKKNKSFKYMQDEDRVLWVSNSYRIKPGEKLSNPEEADHMMRELKYFCDWAAAGKKRPVNYEVAVLVFYRDQYRLLREKLRAFTGQKENSSKFNTKNCDIFLYTIDSFQGQEADIVLLGFTKHTKGAFYNSPNRLNVAITRARHKLYLFGNRQWMAEPWQQTALRELAKRGEKC